MKLPANCLPRRTLCHTAITKPFSITSYLPTVYLRGGADHAIYNIHVSIKFLYIRASMGTITRLWGRMVFCRQLRWNCPNLWRIGRKVLQTIAMKLFNLTTDWYMWTTSWHRSISISIKVWFDHKCPCRSL